MFNSPYLTIQRNMKRLITFIFIICTTSCYLFANETGKCGANLTYTLDTKTFTLTITGIGEMYGWSSERDIPWYKSRSYVEHIILTENVTSIGYKAFYGCRNLKSINISKGIKTIGRNAFTNTALDSVVWDSNNVQLI
ncbi:MAG: leucine-rich repeat protein, partial [Paludibacteraceae bacterium]|nr:leucine-rich repeat protein [Paludibacteraceae bacterium]